MDTCTHSEFQYSNKEVNVIGSDLGHSLDVFLHSGQQLMEQCSLLNL